MKEHISIYWSRRDFRLRDNPALHHAVKTAHEKKGYVLPVFILEDYMCENNPAYQFGLPSRFALATFVPEFAEHFRSFITMRGKGAHSIITLLELLHEYDVHVHVNEDVYIDFYKQIKKIQKHTEYIHVYADRLTVSKDTKSGAGTHYSIFTPFKKAVWQEFVHTAPPPTTDTKTIHPVPESIIKKISQTIPTTKESFLQEMSLARHFLFGKTTYNIDDLVGAAPHYTFSYNNEKEALTYFRTYLKNGMDAYKDTRDTLDIDGTSRMSCALAWGLVSSRTLIAEMKHAFSDTFNNPFSTHSSTGAIHYISELIWREFYAYLLYHNPALMHTEFQTKFRGTIKWVHGTEAEKRFLAWIQGKTGYAVVDAAMMELAQTGWMHNRARMIVASVLTKNLGIDWRAGQEYFRAMLIDLDEASNNGGWQWGASVGADPKPIRIFNPYLQAERYDSQALYQKKWLPEDRFFFELPPLVPHKHAREDALTRYGLSEGIDGEARDY